MKNVVLLIIDSLRYDYLRKEIDGELVCPNIVSLADQGLIATNYFTCGAPTEMALPSIFSSTLPLDHGGYSEGLTNRPDYLHKVLKRNGYKTHALTINITSLNRWNDFCSFENVFNSGRIFYGSGTRLVSKYFNKKEDPAKVKKAFEYMLDFVRDTETGKKLIKKFNKNKTAFILNWIVKYILLALSFRFSKYVQDKDKFIDHAKKIIFYELEKAINEHDFAINNLIENNIKIVQKECPYCVIDELTGTYSATKTLETLKLILDQNEENKNFIYAHLLDVHFPHTYFTFDYKETDWLNSEIEQNNYFYKKIFVDYDGGNDEKKYLASMRYTDSKIGDLLEYLKSKDIMDETLLVLVSDHGAVLSNSPERESSHIARDFYDELYHVPLIICNPQIEHQEINTLASSIDLAPSILDILGIKIPGAFKGRSILDLQSNDEKDQTRVVIMEHTGRGASNPYKQTLTITVRSDKWKVMYRDKLFKNYGNQKVFKIFDLERDRYEQNNLVNDDESIKKTEWMINIAKDRIDTLRKDYMMKK